LRQSGRPSRLIGVVAEKAPAYLLSWRSGDVVETRESSTIADGLAVRRPLAGNVAAIRSLVDDVVAVSEREMLSAIRRLREATGIVAEPSGAAALAAFARIGSNPSVVLVTGGNLAPDVEARLVGGY
jgi:threonine dehydratase